MCITFTPLSIEKMKTMDVSRHVFEDDISIVMPYPKIQTNGIKALLEPFQSDVNLLKSVP